MPLPSLRVVLSGNMPMSCCHAQQSPPLLLFLETPVAPQTELPQLLKMSLLLFLKVYDQQTQTLRVRACKGPLLRRACILLPLLASLAAAL